jgi:hypothetical protein
MWGVLDNEQQCEEHCAQDLRNAHHNTHNNQQHFHNHNNQQPTTTTKTTTTTNNTTPQHHTCLFVQYDFDLNKNSQPTTP